MSDKQLVYTYLGYNIYLDIKKNEYVTEYKGNFYGGPTLESVTQFIDELQWEPYDSFGYYSDKKDLYQAQATKRKKNSDEIEFVILEGDDKDKKKNNKEAQFYYKNNHNDAVYDQIKEIDPDDPNADLKKKALLKALEFETL